MKTIAFSLILSLLTFGVTAQKAVSAATEAPEVQYNFTAPKNGTWLDRFERRQEKMIKILDLTEQQKQSLDKLNDHYVTQRNVLHEDKSLSHNNKEIKLKEMRRMRETQFRAILNDEQIQNGLNCVKPSKKRLSEKNKKEVVSKGFVISLYDFVKYCKAIQHNLLRQPPHQKKTAYLLTPTTNHLDKRTPRFHLFV